MKLAFGFSDLDLQIEEMIYKDLHLGWVCSTCGYHTQVKTNVKFHVESRHLQATGFQCAYCPRILQNRKALINHTSRNHK